MAPVAALLRQLTAIAGGVEFGGIGRGYHTVDGTSCQTGYPGQLIRQGKLADRPQLRLQVSQKDKLCLTDPNGVCQFGDQQGGQQAGEKTARTKQYQVGVQQCLDSLGGCRDRGFEPQGVR